MDQDPLKQKLEDVLPLDHVDKLMQVPAVIPASIEAVCAALTEQEGVEGVTLGRQVGLAASRPSLSVGWLTCC